MGCVLAKHLFLYKGKQLFCGKGEKIINMTGYDSLNPCVFLDLYHTGKQKIQGDQNRCI